MANRDPSYQRGEYLARINRVIDYVEAHLDGDLGLETLAGVANFSRFHFHRVFHAMVGEPVAQFVKRQRLEKAAQLLVNDPRRDITAIALDCGFSSSATFARAFREAFGMSASAWRSGGHAGYRKDRKARSKDDQGDGKAGKANPSGGAYPEGGRRRAMTTAIHTEVEVKERPAMNVAYLRYIGPYAGRGEVFARLFEKLMSWAGPRGLLGPDTTVLTVYHDDPSVTDEDKLRIEACVTVPQGTPVEGEIGTMTVAGGRYAVAHFELDEGEYSGAWQYLYGEWLPGSGYLPDDRPALEIYRNQPEQHPQGKHVVDICIPVKPL